MENQVYYEYEDKSDGKDMVPIELTLLTSIKINIKAENEEELFENIMEFMQTEEFQKLIQSEMVTQGFTYKVLDKDTILKFQ